MAPRSPPPPHVAPSRPFGRIASSCWATHGPPGRPPSPGRRRDRAARWYPVGPSNSTQRGTPRASRSPPEGPFDGPRINSATPVSPRICWWAARNSKPEPAGQEPGSDARSDANLRLVACGALRGAAKSGGGCVAPSLSVSKVRPRARELAVAARTPRTRSSPPTERTRRSRRSIDRVNAMVRSGWRSQSRARATSSRSALYGAPLASQRSGDRSK